MAERDVDELFGGTDAPKPRLGRIAVLLIAGWITVIVGLACSVIPGLLVLAWAWNTVETDWERIANGYYPEDQRRKVVVARIVTYATIFLGLCVLIVQWFLLGWGFYHMLWSAAIEAILDRLP
jgi:hypothetical protein